MTTGSTYIGLDCSRSLSIAVVDRLDKHFRRLTKNVFARYGFAYAGVLSRVVGHRRRGAWAGERAGEDPLAALDRPCRRWPQERRHHRCPGGRGARAGVPAPGAALIERINSYYGYEAVAAVKVVQGTVAMPASRSP
jgi:hypothetical protein